MGERGAMVIGYLIRYSNQYAPEYNSFGIYLGARKTKWSRSHLFHRVLCTDGRVKEFMLKVGEERKIEVLNEEPTNKLKKPVVPAASSSGTLK